MPHMQLKCFHKLCVPQRLTSLPVWGWNLGLLTEQLIIWGFITLCVHYIGSKLSYRETLYFSLKYRSHHLSLFLAERRQTATNPPVILMCTRHGEQEALEQKWLFKDRGNLKLQNLSVDLILCPQWSDDPSRYQSLKYVSDHIKGFLHTLWFEVTSFNSECSPF